MATLVYDEDEQGPPEESIGELMENDEVELAEAGFMEGYRADEDDETGPG